MHSHPPNPALSSRAIDFLDHVPAYQGFRDQYLNPLKPLIFHDPKLPTTWPAAKLWTHQDSQGDLVPRIQAIVASFSGKKAPLVVRAHDESQAYGEENRSEITIGEEFIAQWNGIVHDSEEKQYLYLKDFHLCLARPDLHMYATYPIFQDDWMNAYALHRTEDDYRFLYLGTSGTTTAFHHDVYLSHSWSTSICGIKRWIMIAPEHAHLLFHVHTGEPLAEDLFDDHFKEKGEYPGLDEARQRCLVVWQYPNETVFVPSGWYHSVRNYGPTLSINHNWANPSCIEPMYHALSDQTSKSISLLSDLQSSTPPSEFFSLAYNNLCRPSWGWSYEDFWDVVSWVVENPRGGEKWRLEGDVVQSVETEEMRERIGRMAGQWLDREEAGFLDELRGKVEGVLQKVSESGQ